MSDRYPNKNKIKAFISYRRSDASKLAQWFRHHLEHYPIPDNTSCVNKSIEVFWDKSFEKANPDFWQEKLLPVLRKSDYLILLVSPDTKCEQKDTEDWVREEVNAFVSAFGMERLIIVLGPNCGPEDMPPYVKSLSDKWDCVDVDRFNFWRALPGKQHTQLDDALNKIAVSLLQPEDSELPIFHKEAQKRKSKILRWWSLGISVVFMMLLILTLWALDERQTAIEQRTIADARADAANGQLRLAQNADAIDEALLLTMRGAANFSEVSTNTALSQVLSLYPDAVLKLEADTEISHFRLSNDAKYLAYATAKAFDENAELTFEAILSQSVIDVVDLKGDSIAEDLSHPGTLSEILFSPNGDYLAARGDKGLSLWSLPEGNLVLQTDLTQKVKALAFSQAHNLVAYSSNQRLYYSENQYYEKNTVHLVSLESMEQVDYKGTTYKAGLLAFHPSKPYLAVAGGLLTGSMEDIILLSWQNSEFLLHCNIAVTRNERGTEEYVTQKVLNDMDTNFVRSLDFHPEKAELAFAASDGSASVWQLKNQEDEDNCSQNYLIWHDEYINNVLYVDDGKLLASTSSDKSIRLWRSETGLEVSRNTQDASIQSLSYSNTEKLIMTTSNDRTARIWQVPKLNELSRIRQNNINHQGHISLNSSLFALQKDKNLLLVSGPAKVNSKQIHGRNKAVFSDAQKYVAFAGDGRVDIYATVSWQQSTSKAFNGDIARLVFSPTETELYILDEKNHQIIAWQFIEDRVKFFRPGRKPLWRILNIDSKGEKLLTVSGDDPYILDVWSIETGESEQQLFQDYRPLEAKFINNDKQIISSSLSGQGTLLLHDLAAGTSQTIPQTSHSQQVEVNQTNNVIAYSYADHNYDIWVRILDEQSLKPVYEDIRSNYASKFALHPGNAMIAVPFENTIQIHYWDQQKQPLILEFEEEVRTVAFSENGALFAAGANDKTARIFDTLTGQELFKETHPAPVLEVTFSEDGKTLLSSSDDVSIISFGHNPEVLQRACQLVQQHNLADYYSLDNFPIGRFCLRWQEGVDQTF